MALENAALWQDIDHQDIDQLKRQKNGASIKDANVVHIDHEDETGEFSGSHGDYNTTLDTCECFDYTMRGRPCKHMYRLAMELGIYDTTDNIALLEKMEKQRKKIETILKKLDLDELKEVWKLVKPYKK